MAGCARDVGARQRPELEWKEAEEDGLNDTIIALAGVLKVELREQFAGREREA